MFWDKFMELVISDNPANVRFSNFTLYSGFILSLLSSIIIFVIILRSLYERFQKKILRKVFLGILLIEISFFFLVFFPVIFYAVLVFSNQEKGFTMINLGFVFFLFFLILGSSHYIKHSARIPRKRKKGYNIVYTLLLLESFSFIVLILVPINIIRLIVSLLGLSTVLLFIFFVKNEIKKNSSKLAQAKLELFQYSLISILIPTLFSFFRPFFLERNQYDLALLSLHPFYVFAILSTLFIYWTLNVPEWIRNRYKIPTTRYIKISSLNK